jgi:hypothetical protein
MVNSFTEILWAFNVPTFRAKQSGLLGLPNPENVSTTSKLPTPRSIPGQPKLLKLLKLLKLPKLFKTPFITSDLINRHMSVCYYSDEAVLCGLCSCFYGNYEILLL